MTAKLSSALARLTSFDIGIVAAGVVAFVFSFIGYYTASVSGVTRSTGAWHGFFGWFAAVLALLGAVVLVAAFAKRGQQPAPPYRAVLALFALATVSVFIALFTTGYDTSRLDALGVAGDTGHGYGYWISFAAIVLGATLSLFRAAQASGRLPGPFGRLASLGGASRER
jgi:hypothetical protein